MVFPPELQNLSAELSSSRGGQSAAWWQKAQGLIVTKMPLRFSPGRAHHLDNQWLFILLINRVIIFDLHNSEQLPSPRLVGKPRLAQLDRCAWECQVAARLCDRFTNTAQEAREYQLLADFYQRQAQYREINSWERAPRLPE